MLSGAGCQTIAVVPVVLAAGTSLEEPLLLLCCCCARYEDSNPLVPDSRFGDKPVKFQVVCPHNGTAVLKALKRGYKPIFRCNFLVLQSNAIYLYNEYIVRIPLLFSSSVCVCSSH